MRKTFVTILLALVPALVSLAGNKSAGDVQVFDRGIGRSSTVFIPKGTVGCGASFSWNTVDLGNASEDVGYKMLFSLLQNVHGSFRTMGVSPWVSYFPINNLSVGLKFDYGMTSLNLANASITLGDALSLDASQINYMKQSYMAVLEGRYYMSIANSRRFGMFVGLCAKTGYAQAQNYRMEGGTYNDKHGTYQDIYKFELGLVPGVSVFVMDNAAIELSTGVLGLNYQKVCQSTNQVEESQMETSGASYKINFLSINLGISFYIPTVTEKSIARKNARRAEK